MADANGVDLDELTRRMDGALSNLKSDLAGLRTGRASASLLEPVQVEAYGSKMPLNQVATISVPEPRMIQVQVWDRSMAGAVDKAIRNSGLGINPVSEGQLIRCPIPELNAERRQELAKLAGKYAEQARVAVRNIRRDGMDQLKKAEKNGDISQDEQKGLETKVQAMTDKHIKQIDDMLAAKEAEITQV